jgi:phosphate transport system permease protein
MLGKITSPKYTQRAAMVFVWASGAITILFLLTIITYVFAKGIPSLGWGFLTTAPAGGINADGGISTIIVSTIYLIALTIGILIVPGIGAGIYLAEYAPDNRLTRFIRYGIDTLAGIPSIVFGMFGLALLVTVLHFNFSILSGALTLVCLLLPTMIRTTEEAIRAVPRGHREGSLALGATKWQTIRHVVLPTAFPGIITGIILCVGRALGETACLYLTIGNYTGMPTSIMDPGRPLALHIYYLIMDSNAPQKAMATAVVLIITIIVINAVTNWLSYRFQAKMKGKLS